MEDFRQAGHHQSAYSVVRLMFCYDWLKCPVRLARLPAFVSLVNCVIEPILREAQLGFQTQFHE